jgi:hypothetical protein
MTSKRAKSTKPKATGQKLTLKKKTLKNLSADHRRAGGILGGGPPIRTGEACPQAGGGTGGCQS